MCSNILASLAYGVYISQLSRYARASSNYSDFLKRHLHLRNRQVSGFIEVLGFSPTDRHNISEILLKMALNTITLIPVYFIVKFLPNDYCKTSLLVYWPTCSPQVWYIMGLMPWLLKCGISWV